MSHTIRRRHTHKAHHHRRRQRRQNAPQAPAPVAMPQQVAPAPQPRIVSDHAVLRWLERVTGIDVGAQVRAEILADGRDRLIQQVGKGKIRVAGTNAVLCVANGRVITVVTRDLDPADA